jgi:hypothetical protein
LRDCKICSRLAGTAKKKGHKNKTVHGSAREKEEKIKGAKILNKNSKTTTQKQSSLAVQA